MHQETIQRIVEEIRPRLVDRYLGKIFQLAADSFALDFGLKGGHYLFICTEPAAPRFYLIKRRLKDLEKNSTVLSQFGQRLRSKLAGAALLNVTKDLSERVVRFLFLAQDELSKTETVMLVAQLTGRSANLFLLDEQTRITTSLRPTSHPGQTIESLYESPKSGTRVHDDPEPMSQSGFDSLSAALDSHYQQQEAERSFLQKAGNIQVRLRKEIRQKEKLTENLQKDLAVHGDAQEHKRLGDLLLANLATAEREGTKVLLQDFYTEGVPTIELELDENISLQEQATRFFARYTKAKRATGEIGARLKRISQEIIELRAREAMLENIIGRHDEEALSGFAQPVRHRKAPRTKADRPGNVPGARTYKSSDGYDILVGRRAADNDHLTFRVARSNDLWLHSADYPGSHVVVRRLNRNEIPHRTIIEAAQLAARFSQASKDSKVAVHYALRKYLSKPRGAAPGLVRMSRFKTIVVEPKEVVARA